MFYKEIASKILKRQFYPLNEIHISKSSLLSNYHFLSQRSGLKIAPVLKSNAYGHGIKETALILDELNCPFFCVDSLYEAYELKRAKISTPILIMGYVDPHNLKFKKLPFSYAVYDFLTLERIFAFQPQAGIHLFIDTGMHREGISYDDLEGLVRKIPRGAKIEGIMSHLAMGGNPGNYFTQKQIYLFNKAVGILKSKGIDPPFKHIAASYAILKYSQYPSGSLGNVGRAGIALYGCVTKKFLKPVLSFLATVVQIKTVKKGEKIGYDFTYTAKKDMKVGILSVGYNDGVDVRLSSLGFVLVKGVFCKIVGRVSMNITTIDVSAVSDIKVGEKAVVYSSRRKDKNSIVATAKICKTIPYEVLVHLHPSTKRVVVE